MDSQPTLLTLNKRIDISEISDLMASLDALPIQGEKQHINASNITHLDSSSCQVLISYMARLKNHNSTLIIDQPSEKFLAVSRQLGFAHYFNFS